MTHSLILQDKKARICTLTIQRPESLNALNAEVIRHLADAIQTAQADAEVGVIISVSYTHLTLPTIYSV